jgi:hypothetical protein
MNANKHEFGKSGESSHRRQVHRRIKSDGAVLTDDNLKTMGFEMRSKKSAQKTKKFGISNTECRNTLPMLCAKTVWGLCIAPCIAGNNDLGIVIGGAFRCWDDFRVCESL